MGGALAAGAPRSPPIPPPQKRLLTCAGHTFTLGVRCRNCCRGGCLQLSTSTSRCRRRGRLEQLRLGGGALPKLLCLLCRLHHGFGLQSLFQGRRRTSATFRGHHRTWQADRWVEREGQVHDRSGRRSRHRQLVQHDVAARAAQGGLQREDAQPGSAQLPGLDGTRPSPLPLPPSQCSCTASARCLAACAWGWRKRWPRCAQVGVLGLQRGPESGAARWPQRAQVGLQRWRRGPAVKGGVSPPQTASCRSSVPACPPASSRAAGPQTMHIAQHPPPPPLCRRPPAGGGPSTAGLWRARRDAAPHGARA